MLTPHQEIMLKRREKIATLAEKIYLTKVRADQFSNFLAEKNFKTCLEDAQAVEKMVYQYLKIEGE